MASGSQELCQEQPSSDEKEKKPDLLLSDTEETNRSYPSTPQPTTSTADEGPRDCSSSGEEDLAVSHAETDAPPHISHISDQEGAGFFKIHSMPIKLVASLSKHELQDCWPKLKNFVGKAIWGDERFEPVPTVIEGAVDRYELGAVLLKTKLTSREKWRLQLPRCQAISSIYDLIWDHDMSIDAAVEMAAPMRVEKGAPWPNHRFHGLAFKGGYARQVAVTVTGCHRVAPRALPRPDSLVLNLYRYAGRYRTDKIYVITEVIYAQELHVTVRVSINRDDVKILRRVPLAFRLHVYDVRDLSTLVRQRTYDKPLRVRWTGLADKSQPSTNPRRSRGMGDVTKRPVRLDMVRRGQGYELFANRNDRNQRSVDNGGDRPGQIIPN